MSSLTEAAVKEKLSTISDPALSRNLVALRQVKEISVDGDRVEVSIELVTPAYPAKLRAELVDRVRKGLGEIGASEVEVKMTAVVASQPPPADQARIPGVKNVIAVAAGKGGVGKSTVAANLALALQRHGATVGMLDADVFGPSMPQMLGEADTPADRVGENRITPAIHHGIKVISIGFFIEKGQAVVWRGPMVHRLLQQFVEDVEWGELDYLICDLPPGTGDVQLSLSQLIPLSGAVMVTTPQEVAVVDVVKGIEMLKNVSVPILGLVENMATYRCPSCGHVDEIFSHGGGKRLAKSLEIDFLGEIPIDTRIRHGGDAGVPMVAAAPDSDEAKLFMTIASDVALKVAQQVLAKGRRSPGLTVLR